MDVNMRAIVSILIKSTCERKTGLRSGCSSQFSAALPLSVRASCSELRLSERDMVVDVFVDGGDEQ